MDSSNEIREFLATRRARITPQQAGLATYGRRRVPGLRREEVAMLAGVSTDYYARLERGNLTGVSDSVLEALPAPCASTRPNAHTCTTWPAPPTPRHTPADAPLRNNRSVPSCSASSTE